MIDPILVLEALADGAERNAAIVAAVTHCSPSELMPMVSAGLISLCDRSGDGIVAITPRGKAYLDNARKT